MQEYAVEFSVTYKGLVRRKGISAEEVESDFKNDFLHNTMSFNPDQLRKCRIEAIGPVVAVERTPNV